VEAERAVKSEEEIALLRRVARVTEIGIEAGLAAVRIGATENDVAAEIHHAMFRAGGEYPACSPFVAAGPRCAIGHATWEGRRIEAEEYVFLEVAGCIQRYHTAAMRMAYTGPISEEVRAVEAQVREAVAACMAEMRPGVPASRIDALSREILAGSGAEQSTRVGYAIGIAYAPDWGEGGIFSLQGDNHRPLEANMVFHLIPWVQIPGRAGIGLSETVRVTPHGGASLFTRLEPTVSARF
jgi:Xaa-Pro dipeptidase